MLEAIGFKYTTDRGWPPADQHGREANAGQLRVKQMKNNKRWAGTALSRRLADKNDGDAACRANGIPLRSVVASETQ